MKAVTLLEPALKIRAGDVPHDRPPRRHREELAGRHLRRVGPHGEAEPLLLEADRDLSGVPDVWIAEKRAVLTHLITLYEKWGKPDQAVKYRVRLDQMKATTQ